MGKFIEFWWLIWNMSVCVQEKVPARPVSDTPLSQAVSFIRDHVKGLSGSLLLLTLLATLAGIFLIKAIFSWVLGGRKPRPASADHKTRKAKEPSETAEKSQAAAPSNRAARTPMKKRTCRRAPERGNELLLSLCAFVFGHMQWQMILSQVYIFFPKIKSLISCLSHTSDLRVTTTPFYLFVSKPVKCTVLNVIGLWMLTRVHF